MSVETFEKLGAFYLGKQYDLAAGEVEEELLLYDAKDLTTHAVCVGMTGSGKTGLCVTLLEEAAIDGIPAICIDPKGDLGNLMLTFPQLRPEDFKPWVDPGEASRKGMTVDAYAADRAGLWKKGLKSWGQGPDRIRRLRNAAEVSIYTPGSSAGLGLTVLRSFGAPPPHLRGNAEAMRERVASAVSGLLALLDIDADPLRSREHILLSTILTHAWEHGRDLDLAAMIHEIQTPPVERIGVMAMESFYPAKDRFELAMSLNNLLASPGFAGWMEGEALDISRLLYTADGKPRISILSIAHLPDAERMFFVTLLLNEVVSWMRQQSGTTSLRALLYMDEVFGFLPPTKNPPSKVPMLTLLKQARAYGLGLVLATQNPVDLDYKALSNAGTWFLGRLQTERDKRRVLEGLEGASAATGSAFDRKSMDTMLAGLGSRVFLMNNVHDDGPALFHTRWAMSYLRGPLTRTQISTLMAPAQARATSSPPPPSPGISRPAVAVAAAPLAEAAADADVAPGTPKPPPMPPGVKRVYLPLAGAVGEGETLLYRPALVGVGRLHYVRVAAKVDEWREIALMVPFDDEMHADIWEDADRFTETPDLERRGDSRGRFDELPGCASDPKRYGTWGRGFKDFLYRKHEQTIWQCKELKQYSTLGEDERDFRIRLRDAVRERRDLDVEKLRKRYSSKLTTLRDRIRRAEQKIDREKGEMKRAGLDTVLSGAATVLGALFGRKTSSTTMSRGSSTIKGVGRTAQQRGDVARAKEELVANQQKLADLEAEFAEAVDEMETKADVDALELAAITVRPRKGDLVAKTVALAWMPYRVGGDGLAEPLFGA